MLLSTNIFILSEFFGSNLSDLDNPIFGGMSDYSFIKYSHMVAAVVIIFEIGLGLLFYYYENHQKEDPDEASYASTLTLITFMLIAVCFVEGYIWYQLSSIMAIEGTLIIPEGLPNTAIQFLKGFLGFFGVAFTYGEYLYGYAISKSQNEIKSSLISKCISILFFGFISLWTFLGSGILYFLHILVWILRLSIEFLIIPSIFIFKKIRLIND